MKAGYTGLIIFLLAVFFSGCNQKKKITGREFIPEEVLVEVLVDIHLVDGITNDRRFYRRFEDVDSVDLLGPILEKYQISKKKFDTTMYEYTRYPDLLDNVYDEVLLKLNLMLDENDELINPKKRKQKEE